MDAAQPELFPASVEQTLLSMYGQETTPESVVSPDGYKGLAAVHKYWGKKPIECLGFLIERLTFENQVILDPFIGSGLILRECLARKRRFIGMDINPISIKLSEFFASPPNAIDYREAVIKIERDVRQKVEEAYRLSSGNIATHYLWNGAVLQEVWISGSRGKLRQARAPDGFDLQQAASYDGYCIKHIREPRFYDNARINTFSGLSLYKLFTGRALRGIDLLLEAIKGFPLSIHRALLLTLTAAIGQMSNMVFAITGRGKTTGKASDRIEVGSWVIGYWRPTLHFEINVWNCFSSRAKRFESALKDGQSFNAYESGNDPLSVLAGKAMLSLANTDAISGLKNIPAKSISLVLTDPPHSDRMPYLELSELWNSVLNAYPKYEDEIVVSNAKSRQMSKQRYTDRMKRLMVEIDRILSEGGCLSILFNARQDESWHFLTVIEASTSLKFIGRFDMPYSATSVVQDSRKGALKSDYVLVYAKTTAGYDHARIVANLRDLPGWNLTFPKYGG